MMSKWLVIDASVAHDAQPKKSFPKFIKCYMFLELTKTLGFHVVMTPFIRKEWDHVASQYALIWRGEMISRGRLHVITDVTIKKTCLCLKGTAHNDERCMDEMLKDYPLIIAALKKDKVIISVDDTARRLFADASDLVIEMKIIVWVDPSRDEESPIRWLGAGAEDESHRLLGHFFDARRGNSSLPIDSTVFETFFAEACPNTE
jgi:hypothetical protein